MSLLTFGLILALYDVAEVILKPIFGALSDRIGVKSVILGGLLFFALTSCAGILSPTPLVMAVARLGQGAGASAFSPGPRAPSPGSPERSASAVADALPGAVPTKVALPYLYSALPSAPGVGARYVALAVLAVITTIWAALAVRALPILPILPVLPYGQRRTRPRTRRRRRSAPRRSDRKRDRAPLRTRASSTDHGRIRRHGSDIAFPREDPMRPDRATPPFLDQALAASSYDGGCVRAVLPQTVPTAHHGVLIGRSNSSDRRINEKSTRYCRSQATRRAI